MINFKVLWNMQYLDGFNQEKQWKMQLNQYLD